MWHLAFYAMELGNLKENKVKVKLLILDVGFERLLIWSSKQYLRFRFDN